MKMFEIPIQFRTKRKLESPPEIKSPQEEVLASREKTSSKKIGRGVSDSSFVELRDDGKGVFKTELCDNERAAYLIDRFLGINLTPPTTIRTLDGEIGSIQEFVLDAETFGEITFETKLDYDEFIERHREEFMKMWVFDLIIDNFDRHQGNFLFSNDRLYAIDHGYSLKHGNSENSFLKWVDTSNGFKNFFDRELPQRLIQSIKKFLNNREYQEILEDLLEELLDKKYAAACLKRIRLIGGMIVEAGRIDRKTLEDVKL